jgi:hypothetical protein
MYETSFYLETFQLVIDIDKFLVVWEKVSPGIDRYQYVIMPLFIIHRYASGRE